MKYERRSPLLTPTDAARILGLSADMVKVLNNTGKLPAEFTVSGRRLFRLKDVERLARERAAAVRSELEPPDVA